MYPQVVKKEKRKNLVFTLINSFFVFFVLQFHNCVSLLMHSGLCVAALCFYMCLCRKVMGTKGRSFTESSRILWSKEEISQLVMGLEVGMKVKVVPTHWIKTLIILHFRGKKIHQSLTESPESSFLKSRSQHLWNNFCRWELQTEAPWSRLGEHTLIINSCIGEWGSWLKPKYENDNMT